MRGKESSGRTMRIDMHCRLLVQHLAPRDRTKDVLESIQKKLRGSHVLWKIQLMIDSEVNASPSGRFFAVMLRAKIFVHGLFQRLTRRSCMLLSFSTNAVIP